jgi:hypothetical protein
MKIAVLTNCTATSSVPVVPYLEGSDLGDGHSHASAASEWKERIDRAINSKEGLCEVNQLYTGLSFRTITQAMDKLGAHDADLFIVSLGFGLVKSTDTIASYNLNMQEPDQSPSSLLNVITEETFVPNRWWHAVNATVHGIDNPISRLIESAEYDLVLIALTNNFLNLAAQDISASSNGKAFGKVRIVGPRANNWLLKYMRHIAKRGVIMPYSTALNDMIPGNRLDFAQRAAIHFIQNVLVRDEKGDIETHRKMVEESQGTKGGGLVHSTVTSAKDFLTTLLEERPDITMSEAYGQLVSAGQQIPFNVFQRIWGISQPEENTEDEMSSALAALSKIGIATGYDDQSEVVNALRLFTTALRSRGGGKFQVGDICDWAKIYYDSQKKPIPITLQSRPRLGRLMPTLCDSLKMLKTQNAIGQKIYEVYP